MLSQAEKNKRVIEKRAVIKNADMKNEVQEDAVQIAAYALERFHVEKDVAAHLKKEFDRKHGAPWHCVVGKSFGR